MFNPFLFVEKLFIRIRDAFWNYPELLLIGRDSLLGYVRRVYMLLVPATHFLLSAIILVGIGSFAFVALPDLVNAGTGNSTLTEGVVMGVNQNGDVQRLSKVNPVVVSNIQLEKDLAELIYEPLIRYRLDSSTGNSQIVPVLAEEIVKFREGADYEIRLKRDVFWHDGQQFSVDDVIATFDLISSLNIENPSAQAIKQLKWDRVDDFSIRICTKVSEDDTTSCDGDDDSPIFSNFLELISIKILPEHRIGDINAQTVNTNQPDIFRSPVGTGPYYFAGASQTSATVKYNEAYHNWQREPSIKTIVFELYKTLEDANTALKNGKIHSISTISVEYVNELKQYGYIQTFNSDMIDQQYWGLYFNLRTTPDGDALGKSFLLDAQVREAITLAINRESIIDSALLSAGEISLGTISYRSSFFNPASLWLGDNVEEVRNALINAEFAYDDELSFDQNIQAMNSILYEAGVISQGEEQWLQYNPERASALLDDAGWTIKPGETIRTNSEGERMSFNLYFVNSFDRGNIARSIKQDLERIGVEVVTDRREHPGQSDDQNAPTGWSLEELNNQVLAPRLFDVILYGMNTFVDPDRFELFHSSQQTHPGLNIAGYEGSVEGVQVISVEEREEGDDGLARVPRIDRILDETRSFDPVEAKDRRIEEYNEFQELLNQDFPVIFLYHPEFIYFAHSNVENVTIGRAASLEQRFLQVNEWEIR